jgi:hypothetical protein
MLASKINQEAAQRDVNFLRDCFYREVGCDTNDVLTLFSYWQSNFSQQPVSHQHLAKHDETRGSYENKTVTQQSTFRKNTLDLPRGLEASSQNQTHQIADEFNHFTQGTLLQGIVSTYQQPALAHNHSL